MGETTRNGIIAANVMIPTQPDDDDLSKTSHALATMAVHMAAPDDAPASQMYLKSRCFRAAHWGSSASRTGLSGVSNEVTPWRV